MNNLFAICVIIYTVMILTLWFRAVVRYTFNVFVAKYPEPLWLPRKHERKLWWFTLACGFALAYWHVKVNP